MPDLIPQRITFHGDQISTCKDDQTGKVYCIPREISEQLGVSWGGQSVKLKGPLYQRHTRCLDIETPGGMQEMTLLDTDLLPMWLLSIPVKRVKKGIQEKLLAYQEECAKALRDYWVEGLARRPPQVKNPANQMLIDAITRLDAVEQQAQQAQQEAAQANANAHMALQTQLFQTVAEYVYINKLQRQVPEPWYRALSDHLRIYCGDHNIPFRKVPVGGKRWEQEWAYLQSVYAELLPGWLKRRYAQGHLTILHPPQEGDPA
jgi:P22_AR N-terminal domain